MKNKAYLATLDRIFTIRRVSEGPEFPRLHVGL